MKRVYLNYASRDYSIAQACAIHAAQRYGNFDDLIEFGPQDIEPQFARRHHKVLSQPRGGGYWLWKPHIIAKVFSTLKEGDLLAYLDSGIFLQPGHADHLNRELDLLQRNGKSIIAYQQCHLERHYSKRDILQRLGCDEPHYLNSGQFWAGGIFLIKSSATQAIISDWLSWSEYNERDHYLIDNSENLHGPNHPDFIENRHDQSILSLLLKKHPELLLVRDRDFTRNYLHYFHTPNQAVDIFRLNDHREAQKLKTDWWYQFGQLSRRQKVCAALKRIARKTIPRMAASA